MKEELKKMAINYYWIVLDAMVATLVAVTQDYIRGLEINNSGEEMALIASILTLAFIPLSKAAKKRYDSWRDSKKK